MSIENMILSEKVVLVTGGIGGIGRCCVIKFLKHGVKGVVIADINDGEDVVKELNREYGEGKTTFVKIDVTSRDSFDNAFQKAINTYKNIDILVNCAGIYNEFIWEKVIQINLVGTAYGCELAINKYFPNYKTHTDTYIINLASIVGLVPTTLAPHYGASKHGVVGLTTSYGLNPIILKQNICVMALCPGLTETPMAKSINSTTVVFSELMDKRIKDYRIQRPEVVANSVLEMLQQQEGGSIWTINDKELYKVNLPRLDTLRLFAKDPPKLMSETLD